MKEPVQLCYTISEAAKVMEVEPHVLRYWEEELGLDISRNSMGHRIYTDDDLKTFRAIKQLKANHVALKEIRQQIVVSGEKTPLKKDCEKEFCGDKMTQFKSILSNIIKDAINENTGELSSQISSQVSDDMRKEMDYLARMQEEEQEARFKKLDETIRTLQKARQVGGKGTGSGDDISKRRLPYKKEKNNIRIITPCKSTSFCPFVLYLVLSC